MSNLRSYTTLALVRMRDDIGPLDTDDDARMLDRIREATRFIERETGRIFEPVRAAYKYDWCYGDFLDLRDRTILEITSVVDSTSQTVVSAGLIPIGNSRTDFGPWQSIELDLTKTPPMSFLSTKRQAITVTGVWGWHDDYANAWHNTNLTVQGGGINSSATSITLSANPDVTRDIYGQVGAISPGALIQFGTGTTPEWARVVAAFGGVITVTRGVNGSTAASQIAGTAIWVYEPPKAIQAICGRWASFLTAQDDADFGKTVITGFGDKIVPGQLPTDIPKGLIQYMRRGAI